MYDAEQAFKQARVQQQMAQAQFDLLMLCPRDEAIAEAQSKIAVADEAVKAAQARLALFTIRAPIRGILDNLTCRPGQTIPIGATIGQVVDNRTVLVKAWLPIRSRRLIHEGQAARISFVGPNAAALNTDAQAEIRGEVIFIGGVADAQTGNVPAHIAIDNSDNRLVIGETLYAEITLEQLEATLAVPTAAVHDEGEGSAITVVRDGMAFVLHPQFGQAENGWIVVSGAGLSEGELVIVQGAYNLPDGVAVRTENADNAGTQNHSS